MTSNVEKRFGPRLTWDRWTTVCLDVLQYILLALRDKRLQEPVRLELSSAAGDLLLDTTIRFCPRPEHHCANEALWQRDDIYPIRISIVDGAGLELTGDYDPAQEIHWA